ncbi:MAG: pantoate--beta-alanine ligase [Bacteroidetes bacterium]|nr:pantoate--beta-alanine ligase [Bacteroidota bacterium]
MKLFKTAATLQEHLQKLKKQGLKIGFVPTMGALHNGHIALMKECKKKSDIVVCSIFVNPTQFNDKKDFEKYPITIEKDIFLLETNETDILFLPDVDEVYKEGIHQLQHFDIGYLEKILEGKYRPGHFQGVCNVVVRLLKCVQPDVIFLGKKDYQQYLVLKTMMDKLFPDIQIIAVNIQREKSGLAMSSRNARLSINARKDAAVIYKKLLFIKRNIFKKDFNLLKQDVAEDLLSHGFERIDYIELCDASTLLSTQPVKTKKMIILVAAFIEGVRLIDNLLL